MQRRCSVVNKVENKVKKKMKFVIGFVVYTTLMCSPCQVLATSSGEASQAKALQNVVAYEWIKLAEASGYLISGNRLKNIEKKMTREQKTAAERNVNTRKTGGVF